MFCSFSVHIQSENHGFAVVGLGGRWNRGEFVTVDESLHLWRARSVLHIAEWHLQSRLSLLPGASGLDNISGSTVYDSFWPVEPLQEVRNTVRDG